MSAQRDSLQQRLTVQRQAAEAAATAADNGTAELEAALAESKSLALRLQEDLAAQQRVVDALNERLSAAEAQRHSNELKEQLAVAMDSDHVSELEARLTAAEAQAARSSAAVCRGARCSS